MFNKLITIKSKSGIHARPATLLVQAASKFHSDVFLTYNEKKVNLKSIMGVMSLGIPEGAIVTLEVSGSDENEAVDSLVSTFETLE